MEVFLLNKFRSKKLFKYFISFSILDLGGRGMATSQILRGARPLDLSRIVHDPNRRIFFTSLTLVNKPDAFASTLSLLAKHEIRVLGILSESISEKEVVEVSMFIETSSLISANELESKLKDEMSRENRGCKRAKSF